ncbi:MAG: endonuclease/exonuclease/phosphatase family protein [Bacillota bacterium]|nr:endonuclease/exonuclease/phosphatase family protein [Bacillota bacterium]
MNSVNVKEDGFIRIMTSNVWGNCGANLIANRDDLLAQVFLSLLPDVIGMQEFSPKIRGEIPNLTELISSCYAEVEVEAGEYLNNYTPLVYLRDKYSVLKSGFHSYSGLNDKNSKSITWAVFQSHVEDVRFAVCSTHFYWTGDEAGNAARLNNCDELKAVTDGILKDYNVPVFCIGDFNCTIGSEPMSKLFAHGFTDTHDAATLHASNSGGHHNYPEWDEKTNTFKNAPKPIGTYDNSIDHILLTGERADIFVYETVEMQDALDASDHCPVFADVRID